jgi:hypothetical protein
MGLRKSCIGGLEFGVVMWGLVYEIHDIGEVIIGGGGRVHDMDYEKRVCVN